jgi:hypothetical protein
MHQHGIEYDVLLDNFETGLGRYQKIPKKVIDQTIRDMLQADPDQMVVCTRWSSCSWANRSGMRRRPRLQTS